MKYHITQQDKNLLLQGSLQYACRLFVLDKNRNVIDQLSSLQAAGTYSINSESNIRRTTSFTMYLETSFRNASVEKKLYEWIGYDFELQIGIYSLRDQDFVWYPCGYYLITAANTAYNAAENSITTALSDWYAKLSGSRNGQLGGALTISIPNKDSEGRPVTIKQAAEGLLKTTAASYIVEDIGQFYGMPQNNADYLQYRREHPLWNQLPYDLKYEAGCMMGDIFSEICGLYPNCQMYFDTYGCFCFHMIPSCENDPAVLDDSFLQEILVSDDSESVSYEIESIRNVTEVFGADYEVDRYSPKCTTSANIYTIALEGYDAYQSSDLIAFMPDQANSANMRVRINGLDALALYHDLTGKGIAAGALKAGRLYVLQIRRVDGAYTACFLGQYHPHALCVLTDSADDRKYTKAYFAQKYNCDQDCITLRVEKESPFTVQKLGELLDVKSGNQFANILSDSAAMENAVYYNRMSSSARDTVTIQTKMIPFLDVNEKIEYRKQQEEQPHYYVVKSIVNQTDSCKSTITMSRFYPLYYV
ncbi:MAG: hypothetical protein K2O06_18410 [Acetatifactor sp.]|nr:hypothetical protein [Acetatifactor sp.]